MARTESTRMEFINRGKIDGFIKYFSHRKEHFKDVFDREFSIKTAIEEFNGVMEITGNLKQGMKQR